VLPSRRGYAESRRDFRWNIPQRFKITRVRCDRWAGPAARGSEIIGLTTKSSLDVTRPTLAAHITTRADLVERSSSLFEIVKGGEVKIETTGRYTLADTQKAHRNLEGRKTTGSIVLQP